MNVEGFEDWYRREHPRLVNVLFLVTGSTELAREATDEAFARAVARWPRVRAMESPSGWAYRVALNVAKREARRRSRDADLASAMLVEGWSTELTADPEVWVAVRALPGRMRTAIVLRYVADLPEKEVARVLGVGRGTAASILSRARATLANALGEPLTDHMSRGER